MNTTQLNLLKQFLSTLNLGALCPDNIDFDTVVSHLPQWTTTSTVVPTVANPTYLSWIDKSNVLDPKKKPTSLAFLMDLVIVRADRLGLINKDNIKDIILARLTIQMKGMYFYPYVAEPLGFDNVEKHVREFTSTLLTKYTVLADLPHETSIEHFYRNFLEIFTKVQNCNFDYSINLKPTFEASVYEDKSKFHYEGVLLLSSMMVFSNVIEGKLQSEYEDYLKDIKLNDQGRFERNNFFINTLVKLIEESMTLNRHYIPPHVSFETLNLFKNIQKLLPIYRAMFQ